MFGFGEKCFTSSATYLPCSAELLVCSARPIAILEARTRPARRNLSCARGPGSSLPWVAGTTGDAPGSWRPTADAPRLRDTTAAAREEQERPARPARTRPHASSRVRTHPHVPARARSCPRCLHASARAHTTRPARLHLLIFVLCILFPVGFFSAQSQVISRIFEKARPPACSPASWPRPEGVA